MENEDPKPTGKFFNTPTPDERNLRRKRAAIYVLAVVVTIAAVVGMKLLESIAPLIVLAIALVGLQQWLLRLRN